MTIAAASVELLFCDICKGLGQEHVIQLLARRRRSPEIVFSSRLTTPAAGHLHSDSPLLYEHVNTYFFEWINSIMGSGIKGGGVLTGIA